MLRISRLCPSVILILKVWKYLSLHLMWGHFEKSRTITQQIGINFPEKDFKIYSYRQANHVHTQLEHDFRHVSTLRWKHRYFPKCLEEHFFFLEKKFASLFFNHIFIKEKITYECGEIGLPYLIINEMYFVAGICQTTWSNSSYQEYLQISPRCSPCRYHSLRTCVASLRKSTVISRRVWNVTLSETMKVVKLNRYEYFYLI